MLRILGNSLKWFTIIIKIIILAQLNLKSYLLSPANLKERDFTIPEEITLRNSCLENPHDRTMLYHINQIRQIRQKYLHIEFKVSKR